MDKRDSKLERLLRAAAKMDSAAAEEMPFGFDTRVLAHWRAQPSADPVTARELARLIRLVACGAAFVAVVASGATYWQFNETAALDEPLTNAYAIADTAIEAGAFQ